MASRVLSKYGSYSEATKVKVEAAARLLNYTANGIARSLRLKKTHTIGVMISEIISYHWTVFVQGVEEAARRAGYHVILCNTADDPKRELEYLAEMRERGVDGLIVSPMAVNFPHFSKLAKSGFPIVAMNARVPGDGITRILSDDKQAAAEAVVYLTSLGHRQIALIAGPQEFETGRNRLRGYKQGLEQSGLTFDERLVGYGNFQQAGAYDACKLLLASERSLTAVVVCSEIMTGGALRCLRDLGVSVPDDLSLIGFDDPDWAGFYRPAITTLREERFYMGRLACDALVASIEGPAADFRRAKEIMLRTELVLRGSCALPRSAPELAPPALTALPHRGPSAW